MNAMVKETSTARAERAPMALTVAERAVKVFEALPTVDDLQALAKTSATIVTITNADGREQCHSARMALKNMRLEIARTGEEGRDDAVKTSKAIIAWQKSLIALTQPEEERLGAIQEAWDDRIKAAKEAAIQAEIARVAALQERIAELRGCQILTPASGSALILEHIADLEKIQVDESFEEFRQQAADAKVAAIVRLNSIHAAAVAYEAEQAKAIADRAELAKLRAEQADRDRLAKEAQAKADADAQAERDRLEALSKAERAAETARQAEANRLERDRIAKEEAEQTAARERNEMAMQEIQAIHHQMIIADTGRAPYCKGGDVETLDWLIPQTEKWEITEAKFGALTAMAQKTKESVLIGLRQKRVDLVQRIEDEKAAEFDRQNLADQRAALAVEQEALRKAQEPAPVAEPVAAPIDTREQMLEALLIDARYYVEMFEPRDADESSEQERLLREIGEALPLSATPEVCAAPHCCLPAAHEGPCDNIPW